MSIFSFNTAPIDFSALEPILPVYYIIFYAKKFKKLKFSISS